MKNQWIIPCNQSYFDIISHFSSNDEMLWKATSATAENDIVFIYVCRPYSKIMYCCHVVTTSISEADIMGSPYSALLKPSKNRKNYMKIKLDTVLSDDRLCFEELKKRGLTSVQSQMRIPPEVSAYIEEVIASL